MNFSPTDLRILRELRNNARISNKVLAARVGLAPSTCLARVKRLVEGGAISGFYAEFDPTEIGVSVQAMICIRMSMHDREAIDQFRAHIMAQDEVVSFYLVSGRDDFMMHVAVRDVDHLREFILRALTERPEVDHVETRLMFEGTRNPGFPVYKGASNERDNADDF